VRGPEEAGRKAERVPVRSAAWKTATTGQARPLPKRPKVRAELAPEEAESKAEQVPARSAAWKTATTGQARPLPKRPKVRAPLAVEEVEEVGSKSQPETVRSAAGATGTSA